MKHIDGSVCAPKGFKANGLHCGIRKNKERKDLALIVSEAPCAAAAMFTTNRVKAASVLVTQEYLASGKAQAIICNSGNANACTGEPGMKAARTMAALAAKKLGIDEKLVAVGSTGVIGVPLPVDPIKGSLDALVAGLAATPAGADAALAAIMTTDTKEKKIAIEFPLGGKKARIGAIVKGAGMIHPSMATMLCYVTTDAAIDSGALDKALKAAVNHSFNRVTVDQDTSTNDTIVVLANGLAGNAKVKKTGAEYEAFAAALEYVCVYLARAVAADGEGATKLVTCTVSGAKDEKTAEALAKAIISSSLVKTACFGADANWGRILCAMGYSGAAFEPETVNIGFKSKAGKLAVCKKGASIPFSEEVAKKVLSEAEIEIVVELKKGSVAAGEGKVTAWGCDLTYEYVKINGDYRS